MDHSDSDIYILIPNTHLLHLDCDLSDDDWECWMVAHRTSMCQGLSLHSGGERCMQTC